MQKYVCFRGVSAQQLKSIGICMCTTTRISTKNCAHHICGERLSLFCERFLGSAIYNQLHGLHEQNCLCSVGADSCIAVSPLWFPPEVHGV